jgi:hypothetical protein
MKNQDDILPRDSSEIHPYIVLFQRHLDQLRQHLDGVLPHDSLESSFVGGVYWEASEKNAFFHALSVHSRLRPDLISACIGTKNQAEVLEYMAILERGLQNHSEKDTIQHKNSPLAHEVSDAWIDWEKENAERLQVNEEIWATNINNGIAGVSGQDLDDLDDVPTPADDKSLGLTLGGLSHLTYGHLAVLDSTLNADQSELRTGTNVVSSKMFVTSIHS